MPTKGMMKRHNISLKQALHGIPLLWPALAWLLGLSAARMDVVAWQFDVVLALLLVLLWALRWQRLFCLWMILGLLWGWGGLLNDARQVQVDHTWLGKVIHIQAQVESVRHASSANRLRLSHVQRDDGVNLSGYIDVYLWRARHLPQAGQMISLNVKLHRPRNHQNPGGFDYESYCFKRHIALLGSVRGQVQIVDENTGLLNHLRAKIRQSLPKEQAQEGVLRALLLAEREQVPMAIQEAFAATGAAHLLAISGLHVGILAAWGAMLCWWLLTRREVWIVNLPVHYVALSVGVLFAVVYATLAAWPLPTQRAALMLAAAAMAWWLRARYQPVNILLAALMLILLWDSSAIASISLWLSFVATLALVLFAVRGAEKRATYMAKIWQYMKGLCWVSLVAALATLPFIADVFGRIPVWSLVANILLMPLYALWILPLALLGEFLVLLGAMLPPILDTDIAADVMHWAGQGIELGNALMLKIHVWPAGNLWVADIPLWLGLMYAVGMSVAAWFYLQGRRKLAALGSVLVLSIYIAMVVPERRMSEQWIVWDVGQGAAATYILPQKTAQGWHNQVLVVDVPGRKGSRFNGGTTVAAGLRALGINHIDVLMLSHAQSDHAGGALRLLDSVRSIDELWLADVPANHQYPLMQKLIERIQAAGGHVLWLKQGDVLPWGKAVVRVLWPPKGYAPRNDNNASLVCSIKSPKGAEILLSGDMEKPVEQALVQADLLSKHTMMLMPHHGSRTSSSANMLAILQADMAIAQTGKGNHFGFPKEDIVQRYKQLGVEIWDTAGGAVLWNGQVKGSEVQQYHAAKREKQHVALQWVDFFL